MNSHPVDVSAIDPHDVLTTSRLTVTNAELRVPLAGTFGRVSGSNALPIDALAFADAGAFDTQPSGGAVQRMLLRSVGAGIRLNAGGFVFEFDAVRPLDRTPHAWAFAVNFRPGF